MSLPNTDILKPRQSTTLNVKSIEPINFTTAAVNIFNSMQRGGWGVGAKIINNDAINTITYRLHSNRGTARVVPVSSEVSINEWFDILIVTPNAVTGTGQLEIDYVSFEDARR